MVGHGVREPPSVDYLKLTGELALSGAVRPFRRMEGLACSDPFPATRAVFLEEDWRGRVPSSWNRPGESIWTLIEESVGERPHTNRSKAASKVNVLELVFLRTAEWDYLGGRGTKELYKEDLGGVFCILQGPF